MTRPHTLDDPGSALVELARGATGSMTLVAPFVKAATLQQVLDHVATGVDIVLVTRWRLEEFVSGVSDVEAFEIIANRGGRLLLCPDLHAKIFMSEHQCLVGSANLTAKGLGWATASNLELLVTPSSEQMSQVRALVRELVATSEMVTTELFEAFRAALEGVPRPERAQSDWLPHANEPSQVIEAYFGRPSTSEAKRDLVALALPAGLNDDQLQTQLSLALFASPVILRLQRYLSKPRRFGEVSQWLKRYLGEEDDPKQRWDALMNWLLELQPDRWHYSRPNFTEIMQHAQSKD